MEITGKLNVTFGKELNKSKQRPLEITFEAEGGVKLMLFGVRYYEGTVMDAMATLPGGRPVYHTRFSPELQMKIKEARKKEQNLP